MSTETDTDRATAERPRTNDRPTRRISKDDAFHILQNARRRAVLRYVLESDQRSFVMGNLAEEVAAWEHETTVARLDSDQRQRVYISLYQAHLPKLADHGIVEYDQHRGVVEPTPLVRVLEPYLGNGLSDDEELTVENRDGSESVAERASPFGD
jgi:hypothetical protein